MPAFQTSGAAIKHVFTEENVWASHDQILVETTMSTVPTLLQITPLNK